MTDQPPPVSAEQEELRSIAQSVIQATWNGGDVPTGPSIPASYQLWVSYAKRLASAYLSSLDLRADLQAALDDHSVRVTWSDHEPKPGEERSDLLALLNRGDWSVPWVRREVAALFTELQAAQEREKGLANSLELAHRYIDVLEENKDRTWSAAQRTEEAGG